MQGLVYLAVVGAEQREDLRVDEVELCLDLVAARVVHGGGVLIEHQVLSSGSKSARGQQRAQWLQSHIRVGICMHLSH